MSTYVLANKDKQTKISVYTSKKNIGMHPRISQITCRQDAERCRSPYPAVRTRMITFLLEILGRYQCVRV